MAKIDGLVIMALKLNDKKLHEVLGGSSQILAYKFREFISDDTVSSEEFLAKLQRWSGHKVNVPCEFNYSMADELRILDPAYRICKTDMEKIVQNWYKHPDFGKLQFSINLSATEIYRDAQLRCNKKITQRLLKGFKIPIYYGNHKKKKHTIFHYYCLCYFYVLSRICGRSERESYKLAGRWSRFSAIDLSDRRLQSLYQKNIDIEEYCRKNKIIYNVCLHALSDYLHPNAHLLHRFFAILNKTESGFYNISALFIDAKNDGIAIRITDHELKSSLKRDIVYTIIQQSTGSLSEFIAKKSIQLKKGPRVTSIRLISKTKGKIIIKGIQLMHSIGLDQTKPTVIH